MRLSSISRKFQPYSAVFLAAMLSFGVLGVVWGFAHPVSEFIVSSEEFLEPVPGNEDAGFRSFAWFVVTTGVLGLGVSAWAFSTQRRGPLMMLWTGLSVYLGTWWAAAIGMKITDWRVDFGTELPSPGTQVLYSDMQFTVLALLLPVALALLWYWISAISSDAASFERKNTHPAAEKAA